MRRGRRGSVAGVVVWGGGGREQLATVTSEPPGGGRRSRQRKDDTPLQHRWEWKEFLLSAKKRDESTDGRV